jgi:hypothetical protein
MKLARTLSGLVVVLHVAASGCSKEGKEPTPDVGAEKTAAANQPTAPSQPGATAAAARDTGVKSGSAGLAAVQQAPPAQPPAAQPTKPGAADPDAKPEFARVDADILGVKFGMTPQEVLAALKKSPERTNEVQGIVLQQRNGVTQRETTKDIPASPGFVNQIGSSHNVPVDNIRMDTDNLRVSFALPPDANVVIGMEREQRYQSTGKPREGDTSTEVYWKALESKYGKPTEYANSSGMWLYPASAPDCLAKWHGTRPPGRFDWPRDRGALLGATRCGTHLTIRTAALGGIVNNVTARFGNPLDQFINQARSGAYFQQLQQEEAKRQAAQATAAPKL